MNKRFGFWPHITHVIVLTFKEIKHLSDNRTVGLSDYRSDPHEYMRKGMGCDYDKRNISSGVALVFFLVRRKNARGVRKLKKNGRLKRIFPSLNG